MYLHEIWLPEYVDKVSNHLCYRLDRTAFGWKSLKITFERSTVYPLTRYGSVLNRQHQVFQDLKICIYMKYGSQNMLTRWAIIFVANLIRRQPAKFVKNSFEEATVYPLTRFSSVLNRWAKHSRLEVMYLHEIWLTDYIETISNHLCYILDQTAIG